MPNFAEYFTVGLVPSGKSFEYSAVLTQKDGVTPIGAGMLQTLTLTLKDVDTGAIINSRDQQNVMNAHGVTIDTTGATGALVWSGSNLDSPFVRVDPPPVQGDVERHVAIFEWTWVENAVNEYGGKKVFIDVESYENLDKTSVGSGSIAYSDFVYADDQTTPVLDAVVWVTSDSGGDVLVAGPQQVGPTGKFTFRLDPGSYYLWVESSAFETYSAAITVS